MTPTQKTIDSIRRQMQDCGSTGHHIAQESQDEFEVVVEYYYEVPETDYANDSINSESGDCFVQSAKYIDENGSEFDLPTSIF